MLRAGGPVRAARRPDREEVNDMEIDIRALELLPAQAEAEGLRASCLWTCLGKTCTYTCGETVWSGN
jgi:hypothetical protein